MSCSSSGCSTESDTEASKKRQRRDCENEEDKKQQPNSNKSDHKKKTTARGNSNKKQKKTDGGNLSAGEESSDEGANGEGGDDNDDDVAWDESTHRAFVEAIFHVGVRQASPSIILELMKNEENQPLTTERVKSRLQKYRNNSRKSHSEFMKEYDAFFTKALTVGKAGGAASSYADPGTIMEMMGVEKLMGADVAAFLTYACMAHDANKHGGGNGSPASAAAHASSLPSFLTVSNEQQTEQSASHGGSAGAGNGHFLTPQQLWNGSQEYAKYFTGSKIKIPTLTEEERASPLGASLGHVVSLFYSMTHHVMKMRSTKERSGSISSTTAAPSQHVQQNQSDLSKESKEKTEQQPQDEKAPMRQQQQQQQPVGTSLHPLMPAAAAAVTTTTIGHHAPAPSAQQQRPTQALFTMADLTEQQQQQHQQQQPSTLAVAGMPAAAQVQAPAGIAQTLLAVDPSSDLSYQRMLSDHPQMLQQAISAQRLQLESSQPMAAAPLVNHVNYGGSTSQYSNTVVMPPQAAAKLPTAPSGSLTTAASVHPPSEQRLAYVTAPDGSVVARPAPG